MLLVLLSCVSNRSAQSPGKDSVAFSEADADTDSDSDSDGDADWDYEEEDTATDTGETTCAEALSTAQLLYLSADDSNSQASPVLYRAALENGFQVSGPALPWEFLNYYSFDYPATDAVGLVASMMASSDVEGGIELLVAAVAPAVDASTRMPLNLSFSLDASCSMTGRGLELSQATIRSVASQLQVGDVVSVVTWSADSNILLDGYAVTGPNDGTLLGIADGLESDGSTDLANGLKVGYQLAANHQSAENISRVMLISDGGANTGVTDEELIGEYAGRQQDSAIYLVGVGASYIGGYSRGLMDRVTDLGRGAHVFVDSEAEADHQFGEEERFLENVLVAATDVRLSMELPAGWVVERFSGEQISTDPAEVFPQNLAPNDQMLYHMTLKNCGGDENAGFRFVLTSTDVSGQETETVLETTVSEMMGQSQEQIVKAVALVDAARAMAKLRDLPMAEKLELLGMAQEKVAAALVILPDDLDLQEVAQMLVNYQALL